MALQDLSRVTTILTDAVRTNIAERLEPTLAPSLSVTSLPPERAIGEDNTVNIFLYHLAEDQQRRNLPGNRSDLAPAATKPMSLVLHYILTTHHGAEGMFDTAIEQRLMGYALKTFHDYPIIDDDTRIGTVALMPADLAGGENRLEIALRHLEPEEAVAYWSAEQALTTRLSAYLDVRYAMLQPEPPRRLPGIVLSLGTFVVDIASPQVAATRSVLAFTLPAIAGGGAQSLDASPARTGPPIPALPESNRLTLEGTGLAIGQSRVLLLSNPRWRIRAPALAQVPLDPDLAGNLPRDWAVTVAGGAVEVVTDTALDALLPDGGTVTLPVEPGIYTAALSVVKDSAIQFGRTKLITDRSNAVTFSVIPRIAGVAVQNAAQNVVRITLDPSVDLTPATGPGLPGDLDILVVVDGRGYDRDEDASLDEGEFAPAANTVDVRLTFDPTTPGTYPVRVIVEGAESQPFWFEVP